MPQGGKRVLVIGAGIVGLSCALHAQRNGHRVTVMDPRGFAGGASQGNAGVLAFSECVPVGTPEVLRQAPSLLFGSNSPLTMRWTYAPYMFGWLYRFTKACSLVNVMRSMAALSALLSRARAAHDELASQAGCAEFIRQHGWIKAFESDASYHAAKPDFERMRDRGVCCEYLSREALHALEPNLNPIFKHAVTHPECAQIVDPAAYTRAFGAEFLRNEGEFIQAEVESLEHRAGSVTGARTRTDRYDADIYVIAAGAWSKKLAADAGSLVPLDTERGYHIVLSGRKEAMTTAPVLWAEHSIVMSPNARGLRITSSVEFAGLKRGPDYRKLMEKLPEVRRAYARPPGHVIAEWLGFRPSIPDSVPVIGIAPRADNAIFAFGHGHLGLTLGPLTGRIVGDLIEGRHPAFDMEPYSAARF